MKVNTVLSVVLALLMIATPLSVLSFRVSSAEISPVVPFAGGSGTIDDPYIIEDVYELQNMITNLYANYSLKNDINATVTKTWNGGAGFVPIGNLATRFYGSLNGKGFKINGLVINRTTTDYVGLFGLIEPTVSVSNLSLLGCDIRGKTGAGGIAGHMYQSKVSNCSVTGQIIGDGYVGGLIGFVAEGTIFNCYTTCNVLARLAAGGFAGAIGGTIISNCYASGNVSASQDEIGGFLGNGWGTLSNCYATGQISGIFAIGGFMGYNGGAAISNCYATGDVSGESHLGGLVGYMGIGTSVINSYSTGYIVGNTNIGGLIGSSSGTVTACFWDVETSGRSTSAGGALGKSTAQMMDINTFIGAGWNFNTIWDIDNGQSYPYFRATPYMIYDLSDLQAMVSGLSSHYALANDIDCSNTTGWNAGAGFSPLGNDTNPFYGSLDGRGFNITNLFINRTSMDNVGLFGYLGDNAVISNTTLLGCNITGNYYVGGLLGWNNFGKVSNCSASGNVSGATCVSGLVGVNKRTIIDCYAKCKVDVGGGVEYVGGLVAVNQGTVSNSYATGNLSGMDRVGGLVGDNQGGTVSNSYATGEVNCWGLGGGLVGFNEGTVSNSYATGNVIGAGGYVGGLVGYNNNQLVLNSYSAGNVSGPSNLGGFIGYSNGGSVVDCFWDNETSGRTTSDGGLGKNTSDMMRQVTFTGWDFTIIWGIYETHSYPFLRWVGGGPGVSADLEIILVGFSEPAQLGGTLMYYGTLTNHGPDHAADVKVNITIADETNFLNASGTMNVSGRYITGNPGFVGSGVTIGVFINVSVDSFGTGELNCTAFVTSLTPDAGIYPNETYVTTEVNRAPVASDDTYQTGQDTAFDTPSVLPNDTDADDDTLSVFDFDTTNTIGLVVNNGDGTFSYDPNGQFEYLAEGEVGADFFNYTASDGNSGTDIAMVRININGLNDNPIAENAAYGTDEDTLLSIAAPGLLNNVTEIDGSDIVSVVPNTFLTMKGATVVISETGSFTYDPRTATDLQSLAIGDSAQDSFIYTVYDSKGSMDTGNVTVNVIGLNDAPVITTIDVTTVNEDALYHVDYEGTDVDSGTTLTWAFISNATWLNIISGTGILSGTPDNSDVGSYWVNVFVNDGHSGTDSTNFTLTVVNTNDVPTITTIDVTAVDEDALYYVDYGATDVDAGDVLTWNLYSNATWLSIAPGTGVLSGTPDNSDVGSYWVNVFVNDGQGGTDSTNFTLTVNNVNDLPTITSVNVGESIAGQAYSVDYDAVDIDATDVLAWALATNATWLTIVPATGVLSGNPEPGIFAVNVTVSDGNGGTDYTAFTLTAYADSNGNGIPDYRDPEFLAVVEYNNQTVWNNQTVNQTVYSNNTVNQTVWQNSTSNVTIGVSDADTDGDGWTDAEEILAGTDPLDATDMPVDTDGDGIADFMDIPEAEQPETVTETPAWAWGALVAAIVLGILAALGFMHGKKQESEPPNKEAESE